MSARRSVTIGIDLASDSRETAACVVAWDPRRAEIVRLGCGYDDRALIGLVSELAPGKVAIDAPFGWPRDFVAAIATYGVTGEWPADDIRPLRLRDTDRVVTDETGQQPLSVSADRIAVTAMRCARLLTRFRKAGLQVTRDGDGIAVEAYPAAALRAWGFRPRGYKGPKPESRMTREALVADVLEMCDGWLAVSTDSRQLLVESDHNLDAFVCALVARIVHRGLGRPIPPEHRDAASAEGWIHLPQPDSLRKAQLT